jgi:hypothetical protein
VIGDHAVETALKMVQVANEYVPLKKKKKKERGWGA